MDKQHAVLLGRRQLDQGVTAPVDLAEIAFTQNADQFVRGGICLVTERTHKTGGFPELLRRNLRPTMAAGIDERVELAVFISSSEHGYANVFTRQKATRFG